MNLLPQFPLKLVVFPGEELNLHIFEDRYKELIHDCLDQNIAFGIPSVIENKRFDMGTTVKIVEIAKRYPGGKMDIKTIGVQVYKLLSFENPMNNKLYGGAKVSILENHDDSDIGMNRMIISQIEELYSIMDIEKTTPLEPTTFRTFELAHKIGLTYEQEMNLRSLIFESEKQIFILNHLEKFVPQVKNIELMRSKIQMNGHFKDLESYDLG